MRIVKRMWMVSTLSSFFAIFLAFCEVGYAKTEVMSLQAAIELALKQNLNIQMAHCTRKAALLSNNLKLAGSWLPTINMDLKHGGVWPEGEDEGKIKKKWDVTWCPLSVGYRMNGVIDGIFNVKIHPHANAISRLTAMHTIEKELRQVVLAYFELALAQKKFECANTLIKVAVSRLKTEDERYKVGLGEKLECLDAQLALRQAKLDLLNCEEALKSKRRDLNLKLGNPLHKATLVEAVISVQPIWEMNALNQEGVVDLEVAVQEKTVIIAQHKLSQAKASLFSGLNLSCGVNMERYRYDFYSRDWKDPDPSHIKYRVDANLDLTHLFLLPAKIKEAKAALAKERLKFREMKLALDGGLQDKKWCYQHALALYKVGGEKLKNHKQKLALVKEKYRLKQVKLLDIQNEECEVQKAEIELLSLAFNVKKAEFELYQLVGMFY